jgi:signal transduction histidine kinase
MGSIIAIYFVVRSNRVLQTKYDKIEKETHDIVEQKEELVFVNDSLREISDEKSSMISVVAHDLKTPLGNVEGLANLVLLEKEKLSKAQLEYLTLIIDTSQKAREKVDLMLDVHKIEAEVKSMNKINHNYIDLIKEVIQANSVEAENGNIEIELMDHIRTAEIETDENYFKQILSNILSNAIKFSPKNEKVIVLVTEKDHSIKIDISDLGPGMDESTKKRLFTSYAKIEVGEAEKVTGMGLYIARKLVEKLNGKIRLESTSEEGTTFSVEFLK